MKLNTFIFDSLAYEGAVEETRIIGFVIDHELNQPAKTDIHISDPTGARLRYYIGDADDKLIAIGKVDLEEPTATDLFAGFIISANRGENGITILQCDDYLHQWTWEKIEYDTREELDTDVRQSITDTDHDSELYIGAVGEIGMYAISYVNLGSVFTDETAAANNDTVDDMHLLTDPIAIGDIYYFGFSTKLTGFDMFISQVGNWDGTTRWEYWNGSAWTTLTNGPTGVLSQFEVAGLQTYDWDVEADWELTTVDNKIAYWVRCRVLLRNGITQAPLGRDVTVATPFYLLFDDAMTWTPGDFEGKVLIFPGDLAGKRTVRHWAYDHETRSGGIPYEVDFDSALPTELDDLENVRINDDTFHEMQDDDSGPGTVSNAFQAVYKFREMITQSDRFTGSVTGARVRYIYTADTLNGLGSIILFNPDTIFAVQSTGDRIIDDGEIYDVTFEIPENVLVDVFDTVGDIELHINIPMLETATSTLKTHFCYLELDVETTGYSTGIGIITNGANYLVVDTDLRNADPGLFEGAEYSIVDEIFTHIDSAEGGTLATKDSDGNALTVPLTADVNVEHTTGVTGKNFIREAQFDIITSLRIADGAALYLPLASTALTYKKTFSAVGTIYTDDSFLTYRTANLDGRQLKTDAYVHGIQFTESHVIGHATDATAQDDYGGVERASFTVQAGVTSDFAAETLADAIVEQQKDIRLIVEATASGISVIRVGTEIRLTSTILGLTTEDYVCIRWGHNSFDDITTLLLHPSNDAGFITPVLGLGEIRNMQKDIDQLKRDKYSSPLV